MFDRIRFQLTAAYVGVLGLILIVFGVVVVVIFADQVADRQDDRLSQQAHGKATSFLQGRMEDFIGTPGEPYVAWAPVDPAGRILDPPALILAAPARTPSHLPAEPAEAPAKLDLLSNELAQRAVGEKRSLASTVSDQDGDIRVFTLPVVQAGEVIAVIQVGEPREVVRGTVTNLIMVLVPISLGALLLAAMGGLYMARRAMQPVQHAFDRQRAFIADASHELKTPLTLIKANAEVLSRSSTLADDRELAEDLVSETDRMSALLSDLLTLARLDTSKLSVEQKPFDLASTIAEVTDRFAARATAEGKRLEVRLGSADGKIPARGDAARTGQILAALLDNALRFTPPAGCVTIEGRARGGRAEARVTDAGPGIPAEHLPRIFDRFYRVDVARTRSEDGGGTGLGLSIARDLARAQGGDLTAENTPKGEKSGAILNLELPSGT